MISNQVNKYMSLALSQAETALAEGEVPVGCVIVRGDKVIAQARNRCRELKDPTAHAEMLAIREALRATGDMYLNDCAMYVTLEPCPMCAGAIILARPDVVVWGATDPKRGGGTVFGIFDHPGINHHPQVVAGVLEEPCRLVLQEFFRARRA